MTADAVLGATAVSGAAVTMWWTVAGERRLTRRAARNLRSGLEPVTDGRELALAAPASERAVVPAVHRAARAAVRLTPSGSVDKLNRRIAMAGMSSRWPVDRTLAAKVMLAAVGVVFGLVLISAGGLGVLVGLTVPFALYGAPDFYLQTKANDRQGRVRVALPDTLDQITVCVEAGLGFEAAMARASRTGEGPLADEIVRTLQDIQLGVPRRDAMRGLSDRNDVDELRQFVQAIVQAEAYGGPIAKVLRIQASELREKRRQAAEERAMKISIKLLLPLVFCVLPCVFIVILAPALISLVHSLGTGV
jgi:tight adherence protein C